ncbi:ABC transporter permease [Fulvivirga sediminis]|uniref:ABC transporter permease n=1 Tax=Fulvivirga sediminis TaxID=2803949 RepID=A0A937FB61_9BACT|nr:ABC transporter permease [Fulvivirga sediminis]MBL3657358.1 ABC transporter permease [Fulvivirga sediminis]
MLQNFIKIALRNIRKNRAFSLIHIIGLTVGLASTLLLLMYVKYEYSFDKWNKQSDSIYRLTHTRSVNGEESYQRASVFPELGMELQQALPEITNSCRLFNISSEYDLVFLFNNGKDSFSESSIFLADSSFMDIFDLEPIAGDLHSALSQPNKLVISESLAKKVFNTSNVVGKQLEWQGMSESSYEITAVFKDIPANSHLHFEMLASWFNVYSDRSLRTWDQFYTYVLTNRNIDPERLRAKVNEYSKSYLEEYNSSRNLGSEIGLQPLTAIHLNSNLRGEIEANSDRKVVNALLIIAVAILIIAIFNYINLSTSSSLERSREVGIRKVIGSSRLQLRFQFLLESFCMVVLAHVIAITVVQLSTPIFNRWMESDINIAWWSNIEFYALLSLSIITITLFAGLYPSLVLSQFAPSRLLNEGGSKNKKYSFRSVLMTFQFAIAMLLCAMSLLVYSQINYIVDLSKDFNQNVLVVKSYETLQENMDTTYLGKFHLLGKELSDYPSIEAATVSSTIPGQDYSWVGQVDIGNETRISAARIMVDENFAKVYGIKLLAGRFYESEDELHPLNQLVINRKMATDMGYQDIERAIGRKLNLFGMETTIIGVLEDFHTVSPRSEIEASMYTLVHGHKAFLSVAFQQGNYKEATEAARKEWKELFPDKPFEYFFIDDHMMKQFKSDHRLLQALMGFSILAIFLACLGLMGLANYNANLRKKELSIRKVLGATAIDLGKVLTQKYILLIVLSSVLSFPAFYYVSDIWLQQYATKIGVGGYYYLMPLLTLLVIAIITVLSQILKSIRANPIDHLKSE